MSHGVQTDTPPTAPFDLPEPFCDIQLSSARQEPLWRQLFQQISDLLSKGFLLEGMSLPAERDMAQALGVSRVTVKRCYHELRQQGLVAGRGRAGSVIQAGQAPLPTSPAMRRLKGFTEEMKELGMQASTDLLQLEVREARHIASIFNRPTGTRFLHVVRVRRGDGVPMTRELAWYDLSAVPRMAEWRGDGSTYAWLREHCGVQLTRADQTVEAVLSSREEMQAFGYEEPQPCLLIKRRTYADMPASTLVEYVEGTFRGDAYVYRTQLNV